jgi:PDZ domain-containing protein
MRAPPDNLAKERHFCSFSGSLYKGVGLLSTRTTAGRLGVAGFIRSTAARAIRARATTQIARMAAPSADTATSDNEKIDAFMNNPIVPFPPPQRSASVRSLRVALPLITLSWLLLASILVMAAVRIQRWEIAPGEAMPVGPRIEFSPLAKDKTTPERYPNTNGINFVTAYGGQLSVLDSILGWLDPYVRVDTYKEHFGEQTPTSSKQQGFQAMVSAKQVAEYVAMKTIGLDAEFSAGAVVVAELVCTGFSNTDVACNVLKVGDTITKIDGVAVPTLTVLAQQMVGREAGSTVTLTVIPRNPNDATPDPTKAETRTVRLIANPDQPDKAIIGFVPLDTRTVTLPFEVKISTANIGGPSAGLAFTLALIDELTKGNLMGRGRVVATGTINEDGSVGAIGALEQKAIAARDAGATLFLVPAGQSVIEVNKAREAAGKSVSIVKVGTISEALKALAKNGGDLVATTPL